MSRRNRPEEKDRRRKERLDKPLPGYRAVRMAVCHSCGDYTHVYEPLRYCGRCLDDMQ